MDDGEADTGSLVLLAPVQPLEDAEELVRVPHVEPGAVVSDEENGSLGGFPSSDLDSPGRLVLRVLERVAEQVDEHLLQQVRIGIAIRELADDQLIRLSID